ncbi:uncharacterized protein LOC119097967 [Pollicipes pollicipes]|uniref:uncharacterized protein LOC119097967 n=1 Tax=Pollicipes pollicipes TaxID=41117 RepID=UPI0018857A3F|nr:uncharacterized protein LOC119097967 [Pollicipes pollicipes]
MPSSEAAVAWFEEAVWVVLFERRQLQRLAQARRLPTVTATVLVWYPGEAALYCNRARCKERVLTAVSGALGYAHARPIRLSGRRLSTMRLMFTASTSRKFYDCSIPGDEYPLPI